jgi:hypothetical protein
MGKIGTYLPFARQEATVDELVEELDLHLLPEDWRDSGNVAVAEAIPFRFDPRMFR